MISFRCTDSVEVNFFILFYTSIKHSIKTSVQCKKKKKEEKRYLRVWFKDFSRKGKKRATKQFARKFRETLLCELPYHTLILGGILSNTPIYEWEWKKATARKIVQKAATALFPFYFSLSNVATLNFWYFLLWTFICFAVSIHC